MQKALNIRGLSPSRWLVTEVMRENGWLHEKRRCPKGLTKATTEIEERENLIKQDFTAHAPFSKLLTDITQIQCLDGKLYISPIMDCYNGEILSLLMRDNMKKELCIDTVEAASKRFPIAGAMFHSDRGSQYTSKEFRKALKANDLKQSLSGVHHCFDNARMESFFATLKKELLYRIPTHKMSRSDVRHAIFDYVFTYYNRRRINTANPDGMTPYDYRRKYDLEKAKLQVA